MEPQSPDPFFSPPLHLFPSLDPQTLRHDQFFLDATFSWVSTDPDYIWPVVHQRFTRSCWAIAISGVIWGGVVRELKRNGRWTHDRPILDRPSAQELFDLVHQYWVTLPKDEAYEEDNLVPQLGFGNAPLYAFAYIHYYGLAPASCYRWKNRCQTEGMDLRVDSPVSREVYQDASDASLVYLYRVEECRSILNHEHERLLRRLEKQPLVGRMKATLRFKEWSGQDIYDEDQNSEEWSACNIEHSILIVGYGGDPDNSNDYYVIQNSFGEHWGYKGYGKVRRHMLLHASYFSGCSIQML